MEIEILEVDDREGRFMLSGSTAAFSNGLRRGMMAEVPTMAIDDVNIYENGSVLFDEQIALRLGLIPLVTDLDSYVLNCDCEEGCTSCQVSMTLNVEGPAVVYSSDLVSSDPNIIPAEDKIPIVELKSGQKLYVEVVARLGLGKNHAKWQPVVACGYKNKPVITITECDGCGECVEVCPKGILSIDESTNKVTVSDEIECSLCKLCEKACYLDGIHAGSKEDVFIFRYESDGSLPADKIPLLAVKQLREKAEQFIEGLK